MPVKKGQKINYPKNRTFRKDKGLGTKAMGGYAVLHKTLLKMSEEELIEAMQGELQRGDLARPDMLTRLVARYNRLRAVRVTQNVLGMLAYRSLKDRNVRSAIGLNR